MKLECKLPFLLSRVDWTCDRQEAEDKKTIITLFLARFTRDRGTHILIDQQIFDAMDKTERIREDDCRVLMAAEDGSTKAG